MSGDIILILNAGSSSIKFAVFAVDGEPSVHNLMCDGQFSGIGHAVHFSALDGQDQILVDLTLPDGTTHDQAIARLLVWLDQHYADCTLVAAGHRVVHGGDRYTSPTVITETVLDEIRRLIPLAPLHQPHHVNAIVALQKLHPALVQVACFDTSFHHTNQKVATDFAIPRAMTDAGMRRYGFHGLSYEYIANAMESVLGSQLAEGRVVVAHLGAGASLCAMHRRQSVATTMGFTALDGLPMGRRCGNIDPGLVLYLMQEKHMSADQISHLLYNESGMLGVSGISDDMRTLLDSPEPNAKEAVELFVYRINRELGSLVAALGGLDALIFTAGIGEHAAPIRSMVAAAAAWTGLEIDQQVNLEVRTTHGSSTCLSPKLAKVSAWVIPTNEDLMIAQHTWQLVLSHQPTEEA